MVLGFSPNNNAWSFPITRLHLDQPLLILKALNGSWGQAGAPKAKHNSNTICFRHKRFGKFVMETHKHIFLTHVVWFTSLKKAFQLCDSFQMSIVPPRKKKKKNPEISKLFVLCFCLRIVGLAKSKIFEYILYIYIYFLNKD